MSDIVDRINAETVELRAVREQIIDLLRDLKPWQQKTILSGLYWYGPGTGRSFDAKPFDAEDA